MSITRLCLRPTYDFTPLSKDALAFESTGEFKGFVRQRLEEEFGPSACIEIPDDKIAGDEAAFQDDRELVRVVQRLLEEHSQGRIGTREDEVPIGPICYPDPDTRSGWRRERGIYAQKGSARGSKGPLILGPLPSSLKNIPDYAQRELAALRLYVIVSWAQQFDTPRDSSAPTSPGP